MSGRVVCILRPPVRFNIRTLHTRTRLCVLMRVLIRAWRERGIPAAIFIDNIFAILPSKQAWSKAMHYIPKRQANACSEAQV